MWSVNNKLIKKKQILQTAAQQAFMGNIEHGFNACKAAHESFNTKAELPPLGSDAVS